VPQLFIARLQARNSRTGSLPLITYYDETGGERTELSAISFGNWVDKTAGLIADELLIDPGSTIKLTLARTHPAHWVTLVWVAAAWRAGCSVAADSADDAAVEVVGPEDAFADHDGSIERVACSLHPFGLGFAQPLPDGVIDYGVEVRAQPDAFAGAVPDRLELAWVDDHRRLTHADVIADDSGTEPNPERTMIIPGANADPWLTVRSALIMPVLTGGSTVVVLGADEPRQQAIAESERATSTQQL
jgi:uncharacterized protein (TIGR03089 family)